MMSCNSSPSALSLNKAENPVTRKGSKTTGDTKNQKLSSLLYELALSPDPDYFAKKHDIFLNDHRVRVHIFLDPSTPEPERTKRLKAHHIIIEKGSDDMLRGLAPIDQLIPLSEEPAVRLIRLPDQLIKTRKIRP